MKRVVIAGMGFGGLSAAKSLAGRGLEVVMVDRHNYHLFQPLLYQVATAGLEQESIAYPIRALARRWRGAQFRLGEVTGVDFNDKRLMLEDGEIPYDYLILAAGSRTNFFGQADIERHAFDLKRLDQAEDLRNHVLLAFEHASREPDQKRRRALLTFVIVGGGPTGVEFAGALRELVVHVLSRDYPEVRPDETRIILMEASSSLLSVMPPRLQGYALDRLRSMGVEVMLETRVSGADGEHVHLNGGEVIPTHTLFWSAGVAAVELAGKLGLAQAGAGRIVVAPDLSIEGYPEVFTIGDMACREQDGAPLPMLAPVASQQGQYVARAILAREQGAELPPFRYRDKGTMATIGRSAAVATTHGVSFSGYPAWLVWLLLHLYYLIGFRNRLLVLMNWAYYYWFHERQVRLITASARRSP
ncbi:NAD(P)/FAD-dependent oxidoreductase [Oryzomonas rubra]|uniref:NADH:ubiquinone reductase (non-electrogenic) n=1 Tax=Oryzomonas rubra TaxID=2509454 RepID=A0A5A9X574_9BACT|nr:NAD(P)/FAD-dependent oxidoreductase [Oryzomonas rubra]KAA0888146.1 NAD(P)/FAD-dependent oxidoreductase [Oryzomonas rubra]